MENVALFDLNVHGQSSKCCTVQVGAKGSLNLINSQFTFKKLKIEKLNKFFKIILYHIVLSLKLIMLMDSIKKIQVCAITQKPCSV